MSQIFNFVKPSGTRSGSLKLHSAIARQLTPNAVSQRLANSSRPFRSSRSPLCCTAVLSPDVVFNIATLSVMPFYAMIIAVPQKPLTRKIMASKLPFYCAAALYLALLFCWSPLGNLWSIVKASTLGNNFALHLPDMTIFATAFNSAEFTTLAWLHLVTLDLFQAR